MDKRFIVLILCVSAVIGFLLFTRPDTAQTIIVVRHAESYKNATHLPSTNRDKLTPKGILQAKELGKKFQDWKIDLWVSSQKNRAIQTRDFVLEANVHKGKKLRTDKVNSMKKGKTTWNWRIEQWKSGKDPRPIGGESLQDATQRCLETLAKRNTAKTIIIFSHGDICATLVGHAQDTLIHKRYERHEFPLAGYRIIKIAKNGSWYIAE